MTRLFGAFSRPRETSEVGGMRPGPLFKIVMIGCLLGLLHACFGSVIFQQRQFALRDSSDFYYPLYERIQQEWNAGRLPLWSPEENAGTPLLGNPTAATLYPGKLIYAVLPYSWAARAYIIGHILLAFAAMRCLLRNWSASEAGAAIGAFAFAFGAPVLLQYCNVIFLVGAAWMPLGLRAVDRWFRLGRRAGAIELALVMAMQILGGDPQAAYVVAIGAAGYAVALSPPHTLAPRRWLAIAIFASAAYFAWLYLSFAVPAWLPRRQTATGIVWAGIVSIAFRRWGRRGWTWGLEAKLFGLAGACALALAITGAQLVPVLEFISLSLRTSDLGTNNTYVYSLHPLQILSAALPNVFGTFGGANHNWLTALPPKFEDRVWVPSLYLGGGTLILALSAAGFRKSPPWRGWLTGLFAVSLLASFGEYAGPLFWARQSASLSTALGPPDVAELGDRSDDLPRDGDGSVYWLLTTFFPGFGSFRYPAKMLVPACLALSGLAGLGWDDLMRGRRRKVVAFAFGLAGFGLAAGLAVAAWRGQVLNLLVQSSEKAATSFGPLNAEGAIRDMFSGSIQCVCIAALLAAIAFLTPKKPRLSACLALTLLAVDLGLANAWTILTVPQAVFDAEPSALALIREAEKKNPSPGPFRVHRMRWSPTIWAERESSRRLEEVIRWERDSLRPKYAVPYRLEYTYAMGTTELTDYVAFFNHSRVSLDDDTTRRLGLRPGQKVVSHPRRGFDLWTTRYFILPARLAWNSVHRGYTSFLSDTDEIDPPPGAFDRADGARLKQEWLYEKDVQILYNRAAFPRSWVVHRVRYSRPDKASSAEEDRRLMGEVLFQNDDLSRDDDRRVFDPRTLAWIESDQPREIQRFLSQQIPDPAETVVVDRYEPTRVELTATLKSPGLVVLADVYYPGWKLKIDGRPAAVIRTNRMMRGAVVEAGVHSVVYTYEPFSLKAGVGLSIMGGLALVALVVWTHRRPSILPIAS